jgi:ankyrin repeat protein
MVASRAGRLEIVQLLLDQGAEGNAKDRKFEDTLLIKAALAGDADAVKFLIDKGAEINAKDSEGRTALSYAKQSRKKTFRRCSSLSYTLSDRYHPNKRGNFGFPPKLAFIIIKFLSGREDLNLRPPGPHK